MSYSCEDAIKDIDLLFSTDEIRPKAVAAHFRALRHMTKGTTLEKHNISCQKCWSYYMEMKKKYCGG